MPSFPANLGSNLSLRMWLDGSDGPHNLFNKHVKFPSLSAGNSIDPFAGVQDTLDDSSASSHQKAATNMLTPSNSDSDDMDETLG
jgi:hypothetical protein